MHSNDKLPKNYFRFDEDLKILTLTLTRKNLPKMADKPTPETACISNIKHCTAQSTILARYTRNKLSMIFSFITRTWARAEGKE
jgi:hypothetical protein